MSQELSYVASLSLLKIRMDAFNIEVHRDAAQHWAQLNASELQVLIHSLFLFVCFFDDNSTEHYENSSSRR